MRVELYRILWATQVRRGQIHYSVFISIHSCIQIFKAQKPEIAKTMCEAIKSWDESAERNINYRSLKVLQLDNAVAWLLCSQLFTC